MEDRQDDNPIRPRTVVNRVGGALDESLAGFSIDLGVHFGCRGDPVESILDALRELGTQAGLLSLLPVDGPVEFGLGLAPQDDRQAHGWNRARA